MARPTPSTPLTSTKWSISASTISTVPRSSTRTAWRAVRSPLGVVDVAHHDRGDIVRCTEPGQAANLEDALVLLQRAGGDIDVLRGKPALQHGEGDAEGIEAVPVDGDAHLLVPATGDAHFRDARQLFQGRRHLAARQASEFGEVGGCPSARPGLG